MSGTTPKELRPLLKQAKALGCTVEITRKNHLAIVTPSGARVITSGTTANRRTIDNAKTNLRRAGVAV